jgi:hypothetical protein
VSEIEPIQYKVSNKENKRRRIEKDVQISDRKLFALSSNDISVVQEVISEHVSLIIL